MATNFPGSLDAYADPAPTDQVSVVSHAGQHTNHNDAVEALEAKVGVDGSAVATSLDYKLNHLGGDLTGDVGNAQIAAGAVGGAEVAAAIKDPAAATPGLRTLGTGATQAAAGNDIRLSDSRPPSGAAGGVLSGTYPNPGFAADMATQAELDAHTAQVTGAHAATAVSVNSANLTGVGVNVQVVLEELEDVLDTKAPTASAVMDGDAAGGVLTGTYPNPTFATDMATQAELDAHVTNATGAHGATAISVNSTNLAGTSITVQGALEELEDAIDTKATTASAVMDGDAAGGVLAGTYPNPSFASDMATQVELDAHVNDTTDAHDASAISYVGGTGMSATDVESAIDELANEKANTTSAVMDGDTAGGALSGTYPSPDLAVAAKGSIRVGSAANTTIDKAVGTDGQVLTADAASAGGVKWATGSGGGYTDENAQDAVGAMIADTATIDLTYTDATPELKADVKTGSIGTSHLSFDVATQAELDAHTGDTSAAHAASAVSADSTTLVGTGTDVQAVLEELDNGIADHLADSSAAHAASAIAFTPNGSIAATDVQAAIQEVRDEASGSGIAASIVDVKGDLIAATAADTVARFAAGADDSILMADSAQSSGLKWVAAGTPSTQAFADAAAAGTADTFARGDHKHAMPSLGTGSTNAAAGDDSRLKGYTKQLLTVGSGTYTTPAGATMLKITVIGAGGGGGGMAGSATQAGGGAGGASGAVVYKWIASPAGSYAYTAGAKGAGATAGANSGSTGADSTFGSGGSLITAKGGGGGAFMALGTSVTMNPGGVIGGGAGTASSGGDIHMDGEEGGRAWRASATFALSGSGGSGPFGGGGRFRDDDNAGIPASGYGAGGSGAVVSSTNTARAGGDGSDGLIIVEEFYGA